MTIFEIKRLMAQDYQSRFKINLTLGRFIKAYLLNLNFRVVVRYRIQSYLLDKRKICKILAIMIRNGNIKKYGVEIGLNTKIKGGLNIHHLNGVVIGTEVTIGKNLNIFQQVNIGNKNNKYPKLGNNVTIYPGAKIIGDIVIGDNVVIGTNAVVNKDVCSGDVVAGVPAVVIKKFESEKIQ